MRSHLDLLNAETILDAEDICDTGPTPLDIAEAERQDYEAIVAESERESALLWWALPAAFVLALAASVVWPWGFSS
ncbi:MAG: hypothetical protein HY855_02800 [Burkholderiales bacterium]|nr:hypothetical protein [Burkholderiales bacterium]